MIKLIVLLAAVCVVHAYNKPKALDKWEFNLRLVCEKYSQFEVSVRINEYDFLFHDMGDFEHFTCYNHDCNLKLFAGQHGDGSSWDDEYEVKVEVTHDCTGDRRRQTWLYGNPNANGDDFRLPVGKHSTVDATYYLRSDH